MIAVVAHSPGFGAAYNIAPALRQHWQEAMLICREKDGYREWEPDITLRPLRAGDNWTDLPALEVLAKVIERAEITFIVGESGLRWFAELQREMALRTRRIIAFIVDTAYAHDPRAANRIMAELGIKTVFVLPNLIPCAPLEAIPMWMPVSLPETIHKAERLTIVHSPGTIKKRAQKGTAIIERAIDRLHAGGADFDYETLIGLPQAEVLRRKARAHIVIDQIAPQDCEHGLGLSGLEGLACGAVTISAMPFEGNTAGYIPSPPVYPAYSEAELMAVLASLLGRAAHDLALEGQRGRVWAERHIAFAPWVDYLRRYLPEE